MFVRFIGETETWACFGFCVCLSMPAGFSMQAMICPPHYYRHQTEVKEDLSDIWKEEDPDYKFLNYT